ncbi:hypothetical protein Thiowin_03195 [Thiorhodovibrio winogradskyi]|uniref:Uncharacterized protein n=1 Tax=Thiorhodovibrio winogradskyi TaxID=77007 RepID=A0ABZ0SBT2_9GAMM|nr:hypothetical protein [Thiorhodovibrio winogradskyi]
MNNLAHPPIQQARAKLRVMSADEEARYWAEAREKAMRDEATLLGDAHDQGFEEGRTCEACIEQGDLGDRWLVCAHGVDQIDQQFWFFGEEAEENVIILRIEQVVGFGHGEGQLWFGGESGGSMSPGTEQSGQPLSHDAVNDVALGSRARLGQPKIHQLGRMSFKRGQRVDQRCGHFGKRGLDDVLIALVGQTHGKDGVALRQNTRRQFRRALANQTEREAVLASFLGEAGEGAARWLKAPARRARAK